MEDIREYKLKENVKVKLYSDVEMYRKMFFLMLNYRIEESEKQLIQGNFIEFENAIEKLNKKYGVANE